MQWLGNQHILQSDSMIQQLQHFLSVPGRSKYASKLSIDLRSHTDQHGPPPASVAEGSAAEAEYDASAWEDTPGLVVECDDQPEDLDGADYDMEVAGSSQDDGADMWGHIPHYTPEQYEQMMEWVPDARDQ